MTVPITETEVVLGKVLGGMGIFLALLATISFVPAVDVVFRPYRSLVAVVQLFGVDPARRAVHRYRFVFQHLHETSGGGSAVDCGRAGVHDVCRFRGLPVSWRGGCACCCNSSRSARHFHDFVRGLADLNHLVFFLTLTGLFLFLTVKAIGDAAMAVDGKETKAAVNKPDVNKTGVNKAGARRMRVGTNVLVACGLFVGIVVVVQLIAYKASVQWDMTSSGVNSLSDGTTHLLGDFGFEHQADVAVFRNRPGGGGSVEISRGRCATCWSCMKRRIVARSARAGLTHSRTMRSFRSSSPGFAVTRPFQGGIEAYKQRLGCVHAGCRRSGYTDAGAGRLGTSAAEISRRTDG